MREAKALAERIYDAYNNGLEISLVLRSVLEGVWNEGYEWGLQDGDLASTGNAPQAVNPYLREDSDE